MIILRVIETVMTRLREIIRTSSVVGPPIRTGDSVIVPAVRVSFGFGIGGSQGRGRKGAGSGAGGGAVIEPVGIVTVRKGRAKLLPLRNVHGVTVGVAGIAPALIGLAVRAAVGKRGKKDKMPKQVRYDGG